MHFVEFQFAQRFEILDISERMDFSWRSKSLPYPNHVKNLACFWIVYDWRRLVGNTLPNKKKRR